MYHLPVAGTCVQASTCWLLVQACKLVVQAVHGFSSYALLYFPLTSMSDVRYVQRGIHTNNLVPSPQPFGKVSAGPFLLQGHSRASRTAAGVRTRRRGSKLGQDEYTALPLGTPRKERTDNIYPMTRVLWVCLGSLGIRVRPTLTKWTAWSQTCVGREPPSRPEFARLLSAAPR